MKYPLETGKDLSIVIPVYNEVGSLRPLLDEITAALAEQNLDYEVIFVDDGSNDGSTDLLRELATANPKVTAIFFRRNHGQTAAFAAGFDHARGRLILTMDSDRQNDPADIPKLLAKLEEGYGVVNGWRVKRQDAYLLRKLPSLIANRLIAYFSKVPLHDRGCSLRVFRAEAVRELNLYGELHRFIPEMIHSAGYTMAEVPVNHRRRISGKTKYGISRTFRVLVDLFTIIFLRKYGDRPMHFFGTLGAPLGLLGIILASYLSLTKIWAGIQGGWDAFHGTQIGERPMMSLSVLLIVLGTQFFLMGLLAELLVRTYYETQDKPVYKIKEIVRGDTTSE